MISGIKSFFKLKIFLLKLKFSPFSTFFGKISNKLKNLPRLNKFFLIFAIAFTMFFFGLFFSNFFEEQKNVCNDETPFFECSKTQPYFCMEGSLVEKASYCGCPKLLTKEGEFCFSKYQNEPKKIILKYVLRGEEFEIDFIVFKGMADYLSNLSRFISYNDGKKPLRKDFKFRNINEEEQRELLLPLIKKIQEITSNKEDQVRIAISLVQNIPFGESDKMVKLRTRQEVAYARYPYEVLYDVKGVCGEKSELLAFILRELGYDVAFFYHQEENHESIGIKCPIEQSLGGTGYCFIETTGPSIISDDSIEYVGGIKLESNPEIILVSKGFSLSSDLYEYEDADVMEKINFLFEKNGEVGVFNNLKLKSLKQKYGLGRSYNL